MFRLSREVRFAVNPEEDNQLAAGPSNSFAGYPSLLGIGHYLAVETTVQAQPNPDSGYVCDIKEIDRIVREQTIPVVTAFVRRRRLAGTGMLIADVFERLRDAWPGVQLHRLRIALSPYLTMSLIASEFPMVRLSQKFEFSASHRLHNPALSDEQNRQLFGKCNNPHGHGHNYLLQVTLAGKPDADGHIMEVGKFERLVSATVIEPLDHKNLNVEIPEFSNLNPTVENIAMVIFRMLKPKFDALQIKLAGVTLWETTKTWCEYME